MIQKNIFQTWWTRDLPPEIQGIINRLKEMNPNYNYYLYTDEEMDNFVKDYYPGEIYECYSRLNLIVAKADFWRYLVLYKYGGVYLDIDSAIDVRLDDFIGIEDAILSPESNRDTFTQWALFFNMNHPILKRTIEFVVDNIKHNRYPHNVLQMTGPIVFAQAIQSIHQEYFGHSLDVINIGGNTDIIYTYCSESYRIFSNDYRPHIQFKHAHTDLLYNNKPHWTTLTHKGVVKQNTEIYNTETYNTKYGKITLYKNEFYIGSDFKAGRYWDEETILKLREYIPPNRNILEIGGHCGTTTIVYCGFLNNNNKIYVYEPQKNMYNLLVHNINQNNLQHKIIPHNSGVFCYDGTGKMNNVDLDGGGGLVEKRYYEESNLQCNFGGIGLGADGEVINITTI